MISTRCGKPGGAGGNKMLTITLGVHFFKFSFQSKVQSIFSILWDVSRKNLLTIEDMKVWYNKKTKKREPKIVHRLKHGLYEPFSKCGPWLTNFPR